MDTSTTPHEATPGVKLHLPFDVEARRARMGAPLGDPEPMPPVAPVRDVLGESFYVDAAHSIADPERRNKNAEAMRPLRTYVAAVEKLADGFVRSAPANPKYRERALELLDGWASAGALLGRTNQQGSYERQWTLGSLALAYLKIQEAPETQDRAVRERIEHWFLAIARAVVPEYERPHRTDNRNNHAYWAGLAVLAAGLSANDRTLFDWGLSRVRIGISEVGRDGSLPREMARGILALHYHVFALAPLVVAAELAVANGIDLYAENDHAIDRLAGLVTEAIEDPREFGRRAGAEQVFRVPPRGSDLAWAEPYQARFPNATLAAWIQAARPIVDARLGGDVTLAFGAELP